MPQTHIARLNKQGAWPDGRYDMRLSRIITVYLKISIFRCKMNSTICVEWAADHFGLGLM